MHLAVKFAGKVHGNGPDWCKSSCAVAYWKNPTQATFKLTDPWFCWYCAQAKKSLLILLLIVAGVLEQMTMTKIKGFGCED